MLHPVRKSSDVTRAPHERSAVPQAETFRCSRRDRSAETAQDYVEAIADLSAFGEPLRTGHSYGGNRYQQLSTFVYRSGEYGQIAACWSVRYMTSGIKSRAVTRTVK